MKGRPAPDEAAAYYQGYIGRVPGDDVLETLRAQLEAVPARLGRISEERSRHRYAPGKWSLRELIGHVNDTERVFVSRAFWFARGFASPLPDFDQEVCAAAAGAEERSWASLVEEFAHVRRATLALFESLPPDAWSKSGMGAGNRFTVRALAYVAAGHVAHHLAVLEELYT